MAAPEEQEAVQCAQKQLVSTPGVRDVKIRSGKRPIIAYTYVDLAGKSVISSVRIEGDARPREPISYYYELIDDFWMGGGRWSGVSHYDVRELMENCDLGTIIVTD